MFPALRSHVRLPITQFHVTSYYVYKMKLKWKSGKV